MSLTNCSPEEIARSASSSSLTLARLSAEARNQALTKIHAALLDAKDFILKANADDLAVGRQAAQSGELSQSIVKRLDLSRQGKYDDMLKGILGVRELNDPGACILLNHLHRCMPSG